MRLDFKNQKEAEISVDNHPVKLTHLDKVFWPNEDIRKGDLIEYYYKIAPIILPYLEDRPESLLRLPNGIDQAGFFQKNLEGFIPEWADAVAIETEGGKSVCYLICNEIATLLYMINLGAVDINVWNSRVGNLDNPDYLVIDLDPLGVGLDEVIKSAQIVNRVLTRIGIKSYPKTSGATGIHVYIPTGAKYDYDQVKNFAKLLVTLIYHEEGGKLTSIERNPKNREGKVYLDFLQNIEGQTMATPYCVRPRPGAPVSTPLRWEEVKPGLNPNQFNIDNIFERIDLLGDIFKPVLEEGVEIRAILENIEKIDR